MTALLQVENLWIAFDTPRGHLQPLCGVSFDIQPGEIFGLVGETGCGKSLTGLSILRLIPRSGRITAGNIRFRGVNLLEMSEDEMRGIRGSAIATIFQDPTSSLNPVFQIGAQLSQVLRQHRHLSRADAKAEVLKTLESVGLPDVNRIFQAYPHELSGGMQQRVMIAMALLCQPALIIADEPTTALDVTIQAQILRLLRDLRDRLNVAILLISHDLGVIARMCDRIGVLYAGRVVETGTAATLLTSPHHPYTQGLIGAMPRAARRGEPLAAITGTVPANPGAAVGCAFAPRCAHAFSYCQQAQPPLYPLSPGHSSACFLADEELQHGG
jgi:oligopeptide/dipeptide ABC transporter ATP-binding protein